MHADAVNEKYYNCTLEDWARTEERSKHRKDITRGRKRVSIGKSKVAAEVCHEVKEERYICQQDLKAEIRASLKKRLQ